MKLNGDIKMKSLAPESADQPTYRIPSFHTDRITSLEAQTDPGHL